MGQPRAERVVEGRWVLTLLLVIHCRHYLGAPAVLKFAGRLGKVVSVGTGRLPVRRSVQALRDTRLIVEVAHGRTIFPSPTYSCHSLTRRRRRTPGLHPTKQPLRRGV